MRRAPRLRGCARQDVPMRHITDDERRQRLARRHALARGHRHGDPLSATTGMTVLHATEAASVYLALVARVHELDAADVDRALYEDRTLVKQLAMRRTLFVFPRDLLPAAWSSAGAGRRSSSAARSARIWSPRAGPLTATHGWRMLGRPCLERCRRGR